MRSEILNPDCSNGYRLHGANALPFIRMCGDMQGNTERSRPKDSKKIRGKEHLAVQRL